MPEQARVGYLRSSLLDGHGFSGIFSLRDGGISLPPFNSLNLGHGLGDADANVDVNLQRLLKAATMGRPHQAVQVHGHEALICSGPGQAHDAEADILISPSGDAVAARVADCLPILIADSQSRMTAAVHAGWRGTVAQVAAMAVARMTEFGANPNDLLATLGPCIGSCCFAIDEKTAHRLTSCVAGAELHVSDVAPYYANLQAINLLQLRQAGLSSERIETFDICTSCDASHCFSYRRDDGKTGRHLAIIALRPPGGTAEDGTFLEFP